MNISKAANLVVVIALIALPYYLFEGRFFIGGDDTRLFYLYPLEWIKNISWYSWFNFSSVGLNNPNQFSIPLLGLVAGAHFLIPSQLIASYLAFSAPFIIGFLFFQKLFTLAVGREGIWMGMIGALIYVLSPIVLVNQMSIFLYAVWLVAYIPFILYYLAQYLISGRGQYVAIAVIGSSILSLAIFSIPWLLGFLLPLVLSLLVCLGFFRKNVWQVLRRSLIFCGGLLLAQAFWLGSFIMQFFDAAGSFGDMVMSEETSNTFAPVVESTARSNSIIYPLANLFHRGIAEDFNWLLLKDFVNFYDYIFYLNILFALAIILGMLHFKNHLHVMQKAVYVIGITCFVISLFFFTVKIGFLEQVFLFFGNVPGFAMFRNFYDKFALGYAFYYAFLVAFSMYIITQSWPRLRVVIAVASLFIVCVNIIPVKSIVTSPLWTTSDVYRNVVLPDEYTNFMAQVSNTVPEMSNILSLPFNIAAYTIVKDANTNNVFAGRSPVQLFTGINDFSGDLSFPADVTKEFKMYVAEKRYAELGEFFVRYNIGYIFVTKNIPEQVLSSYLFDKDFLATQDKGFYDAILGDMLLESEQGNYQLYKTKLPTQLFDIPNGDVQKVSPVEYKIVLNGLYDEQNIVFRDTFHAGWKLYDRYTDPSLSMLPKDYFSNTHDLVEGYANMWTVTRADIEKNFPKNTYVVNDDGSINIELTLYFRPQAYFYAGAVISGLTLLGCLGYLGYDGVRTSTQRRRRRAALVKS